MPAQPLDPTTEFLTLEQASAYLATSQKTIRRAIADGDLAAYRFRKRLLRIRRADLDALMRPVPTVATTR